MNKTILFSPVGGTDPISQDNCFDGSLLHICRVYKPDEVILYMSKEVLEKQEKDDRYRRAILKLCENQNRPSVIIQEIERPDLTNVQEFDFFYDEFQNILSEIQKEMDESDTLILNVSSGTPAMKSGLLIIQNYSDLHAKVVQVLTPTGKMTDHTHDDGKNRKDIYDLDTLWELNEDNSENFINRCREIQCPSFTRLKNEETIKKLITAYDYQAAIMIADTLPAEVTAPYYPLIQMAYYRTLLDYSKTNELIERTGFDCFPIKSGDKRKYFEYTLNVFLKYKRGLYSDYILSITPIVVNLFELILKKQAGFDLSKYISEKTPGDRTWDQRKMQGTEIDSLINDYYLNTQNRAFKYGHVYSATLFILIQKLCKDERLEELCRNMRSIEDNVRNVIAHQIVKVDEDIIKKQTGGYSCKQIMDLIKSLFSYTDIPVKKEYWMSYEMLNEEIFRRIRAE